MEPQAWWAIVVALSMAGIGLCIAWPHMGGESRDPHNEDDDLPPLE